MSVPVHIGSLSWSGIPLYAVAIGSLLVGLVLAFLLSLFNWATSSLTMHGKDVRAHKAETTVADLQAKISDLETKNTELKTKLHEPETVRTEDETSPLRRFTQSFSR